MTYSANTKASTDWNTEHRGFTSERFGNLKITRYPNALFQKDVLVWPAVVLSIYTELIHRYQTQDKKDRTAYELATISVGWEKLHEATGYNRKDLAKGSAQLEGKVVHNQSKKPDAVPRPNARKKAQRPPLIMRMGNKLSTQRSAKGKMLPQQYVLLYPGKSKPTPLKTFAGDKDKDTPQLWYHNRVPYFMGPRCVITDPTRPWSMANIKGHPYKLYVTILWTVNRANVNDNVVANSCQGKVSDLMKFSGMGDSPFNSALATLQNVGLIKFDKYGEEHDEYIVHICDPYTGRPLVVFDPMDDPQNNPQNYRWSDDGRRFCCNIPDSESLESWLRRSKYTGPIERQPNGWLMIRCPLPGHIDKNPSCGVTRTGYRCFSCGSGSLHKLASALGAVTFKEPHAPIIAKYQYTDAGGTATYQKIRLPDKPDGKKDFKFRHRKQDAHGKYGPWELGLGPHSQTLYNLNLLQRATTVILTEGEKDADTGTALRFTEREKAADTGQRFIDDWCNVVGATSGDAGSWRQEFIEHLRGKRVIFVPDDDEAGRRYEAAVEDSLNTAGIMHKIISLKGTGPKDLTEYMESHSVEDFERLVEDTDWRHIKMEELCNQAQA
jgi:hypothetical protein